MFNNFFGRINFLGLSQRDGGISAGNSPIPGSGNSIFVTTVGTNAYSATTPTTVGSYTQGLSVNVLFQNSNTGPSTLSLNGIGNIPIKKNGGVDNLSSGDIIAGGIYNLVYDGSVFQIVINTAL